MTDVPRIPSANRRRAIIGALRRGTVPEAGLGYLAVGLDHLTPSIEQELADLAASNHAAMFKALRGEYGAGKTFFGRWLQEQARGRGFATSEIQISETETPLHRMETVYRRLIERLGLPTAPMPALRAAIDGWLFTLEADVVSAGTVPDDDRAALDAAVSRLMEERLTALSQQAQPFAAVIRAYRAAIDAGDEATAEGLIAWLSGQPNVAAAIRRKAGLRGDVDHFAAGGFLAALLVILRDQGLRGLVCVLDEVETLQRMRTDTRDKGLNALRQWMDEIDGGRYPGFYLLITGTSAFFDGPQGIRRSPPLAQRMHTDFSTDGRFDNPRAVQVRLQGFGRDQLIAVGTKVRDLFAVDAVAPERIRKTVDDALLGRLADAVAGQLGGQVGIAPRLFLKKLVADVLDRVELHPDFDPGRDYSPLVNMNEMTRAERAGAGCDDPDDIALPDP